ncbi:uncharacterized protein LOC124518707 isoform X2 [Lynx rufus]|uniref:uncharacterized protein LOC124518707 isoform X2 n=1 Tax=Lynx rufus TaxID=61384 RepID=UPI001F125D5B|nr:uncharacterized protein LOC124518707 isoform X2 [Lynx rufus]
MGTQRLASTPEPKESCGQGDPPTITRGMCSTSPPSLIAMTQHKEGWKKECPRRRKGEEVAHSLSASPATGPHSRRSADSRSVWLLLSSSSSISNLSTRNSRVSILLPSCDILIHCPHFLCYSFFSILSVVKISFIHYQGVYISFSLCLFHTTVCPAFLPKYSESSPGLGCFFNAKTSAKCQ